MKFLFILYFSFNFEDKEMGVLILKLAFIFKIAKELFLKINFLFGLRNNYLYIIKNNAVFKIVYVKYRNSNFKILLLRLLQQSQLISMSSPACSSLSSNVTEKYRA